MSSYINERSTDNIGEIKICVAKSTGVYSYQVIYTDEEVKDSKEMTRISEFESIRFRPRAKEEIIPEMVSKIDLEIQETLVAQAQTIQRLNEKRANLLALSFDPESRTPMSVDDDIPF